MKLAFCRVSLLAISCLVLAVAPATAQELPKDQLAGLAAARANAFVNLTSNVYSMLSTSGRTIAGIVARDAKLRRGVIAALQAARVADGPNIASDGLLHVAVEFDTSSLPRDLASKMSGLPKTVQADGIAHVKTAFLAVSGGIADCTDEVQAWAAKPLEAKGEANVSSRLNREAATAAARNQALAAAYTALTKDTFALLLDADVSIGAFLKQHPRLRHKVNAAIAGAALVSESVDREGTVYTVKISLLGKALLPPLKLGRFRSASESTLAGDAADLARTNAYNNARDNLKRRIHRLKLRTGAKVETLIAKDATLKAQIKRLCRARPINRTEFTADGMARIYVSMKTRSLPSKLTQVLANGTVTRLAAVGAGLPVQKAPAKPDKKPGAEKKGPEAKAEPKTKPEADKPEAKPEADKPGAKPEADKPEAKPKADAPAAGKGA